MRIDARRLVVATALTLVASAASALAVAPEAPATGFSETIVNKAAGSKLHVRWTAIVHEGGEFVLGRVGPLGFEPLVRLKADPRLTSYEAELVAGVETALHELRFRDRRGREFPLHGVLVSRPPVPAFGETTTALSFSRAQALAAAPGILLPLPAFEDSRPLVEVAVASGPRPEPPTPPPERAARS